MLGSGTLIGYFGYSIYNYVHLNSKVAVLNPEGFTNFTLVAKEAVSSTISVFTLRPTKHVDENREVYSRIWHEGVWSVQVKQPQLQIARSYTPLLPMQSVPDVLHTDLQFLIRRNPQGEVSSYLHKLPIGAKVELRGPRLEYAIPNDVDEVLFLAGGTGIAPALQVFHTLAQLRPITTKRTPIIRILWANRRQEDALGMPMNDFGPRHLSWMARPNDLGVPYNSNNRSFLSYLLSLLRKEHSGKLSVHYFVDEQGSFINKSTLTKHLSDSAIGDKERLEGGSAGRKLILVSGPEGFVSHYAGPKTWQGGIERQGPLGGVLKELDLSGWEIWKL